LIVDDEPMIRHTLNEGPRECEYDTVEAGTVECALASFEAGRPAAVPLDINLPDGSGLDAPREIKKRQPQVVVIMMTATYCSKTRSRRRAAALTTSSAGRSTPACRRGEIEYLEIGAKYESPVGY
jgi:DNA-binding response OmpR family regulator